MTAAVTARKLSLSYGDTVAVDGIDLEVAAGELHVLLGESGSGKTTLLRGLAGFERVSGGELRLFGDVVDSAESGVFVPPEGRHVGVVFQDYALFPHLDVAGNVRFGCRDRSRENIAELLGAVGLDGYDSRDVSELSGGEQQRVALARALAQRPRLVLLDEPYSNLNRSLRRRLRDQTVQILRERDVSAVFVTHDRDEAFAIADRISVIDAGSLLQTGTPRELYTAPSSRAVAHAVGDASFLAASFDGATARCALGEVSLRNPATSGQLVIRPEQLSLQPAQNGVQANGTVVAVRYVGAIDEVDVELEGGEIVTLSADTGVAECAQEVAVSVVGPVAIVEGS